MIVFQLYYKVHSGNRSSSVLHQPKQEQLEHCNFNHVYNKLEHNKVAIYPKIPRGNNYHPVRAFHCSAIMPIPFILTLMCARLVSCFTQPDPSAPSSLQ